MDRIYLDHAATTYVTDEVLKEMIPYFGEKFGNPNSQHSFGRETQKVVDIAREQVAKAIGCKFNEVYFTSCGTESDNWALKGIAYAHKDKGNHIITSVIEHPAVYNTCKQLEKEGFEVTYLGVDEFGLISLTELENAITDKTVLISIMTANNEIGTVEPIKEIGEIAKRHGVLFHTDAVQAIGAVDVNVVENNIDLLSLSAHKFYAPKGIGVLYIKNGVKIAKQIIGGEQERKMRGGTTNVPLIVGLGKAIEIATTEMEKNNEHVKNLRDTFIEKVEKRIPHIKFNGHRERRLCNNANFSFRFIEGESILFSLDLNGIAVSSGSACSSGSLEPSRVLLAIGVPIGLAHGSIRFSFGKCNTMQDVDKVVDVLEENVLRLRKMSPLWDEREVK